MIAVFWSVFGSWQWGLPTICPSQKRVPVSGSPGHSSCKPFRSGYPDKPQSRRECLFVFCTSLTPYQPDIPKNLPADLFYPEKNPDGSLYVIQIMSGDRGVGRVQMKTGPSLNLPDRAFHGCVLVNSTGNLGKILPQIGNENVSSHDRNVPVRPLVIPGTRPPRI